MGSTWVVLWVCMFFASGVAEQLSSRTSPWAIVKGSVELPGLSQADVVVDHWRVAGGSLPQLLSAVHPMGSTSGDAQTSTPIPA